MALNKKFVFRFGGYLLAGGLVCLVAFLAVYLKAVNDARKARFNVDVLQQYIEAYRLVEGRQITSLSELPDFHVISAFDSFSLRSRDFKKGLLSGYIYDMQYLGEGRYVISASPVGMISSGVEFGITDKGRLTMNSQDSDPTADGYDEVEQWQGLPRTERARTAELPEYLAE